MTPTYTCLTAGFVPREVCEPESGALDRAASGIFYSGRVEGSESRVRTAGPSGPAARQHTGSKSTATCVCAEPWMPSQAQAIVTGTCHQPPPQGHTQRG